MLGDLEGQRLGHGPERDLSVQRVEQRGNMSAGELHVDDRSGYPNHPAGGVVAVAGGGVGAVALVDDGHGPLRFLVPLGWSLLGCVGESVCATDDFADFLGNPGLTFTIGHQGEDLDQIVGVVGGRLHGTPSRRRLRCGRLQQCGENPSSHVARQ